MKKTIIIATALVAMTACNKSLIDSQINESEYGYINLGVSADTEMIVTKAAVSEEGKANYRVALYKGNDLVWGTEEGATDGFVSYSEAVKEVNKSKLWKVEAGTYKVYVENVVESNCYPDNAAGSVYIQGDNTVTVSAGISTDCSVACTPKNSKVTFAYGEDFTTSFETTGLSISASCEGRTVTSSLTNDHTSPAYFPKEKTLTWTLIATPRNQSSAYNYTGSITTVSATWHKITFTTGETNGQIKVTITANDEFTNSETKTYLVDPFNNGTVTEGSSNN